MMKRINKLTIIWVVLLMSCKLKPELITRYYSDTVEESKENKLFLSYYDPNINSPIISKLLVSNSCWVEKNGFYEAGFFRKISLQNGYRMQICLKDKIVFSDNLKFYLITKNKVDTLSPMISSSRPNCPIIWISQISDSIRLIVSKNNMLIDTFDLVKRL